MTFDASLRAAPVVDRDGYAYVVHPLTDGVPRADPALLQEWRDWATEQTDLLDGATILVAPEAMALPLVAPLSMATGIPYVVVRKRHYGLEAEQRFEAVTGYGTSTFYLNDIREGDVPVVVDDLYSTGHTLTALAETLAGVGAPARGALVLVAKGTPPADIAGMPLRCMRRIDVSDGKTRIL